MYTENIPIQKSTLLRKTDSKELIIEIEQKHQKGIFLINGSNFKTEGIISSDLLIKSYTYYMIINRGIDILNIQYNQEIFEHQVIYDPYKYESSSKKHLEPDWFIERYNIPEGYIDTLPKWYSFKFTYPDYNLIFVRPEFGLSIQIHKHRNETWEVLEGKPIIITGNKVHYFVETGFICQNPINTYHSIINPNKEENKYVLIKESWNGDFDETDINRVFNPNQYQ